MNWRNGNFKYSEFCYGFFSNFHCLVSLPTANTKSWNRNNGLTHTSPRSCRLFVYHTWYRWTTKYILMDFLRNPRKSWEKFNIFVIHKHERYNSFGEINQCERIEMESICVFGFRLNYIMKTEKHRPISASEIPSSKTNRISTEKWMNQSDAVLFVVSKHDRIYDSSPVDIFLNFPFTILPLYNWMQFYFCHNKMHDSPFCSSSVGCCS